MNCQECRDLFDDMLDRRIKEPLKRRMLNHLANCPECSAGLERRRKAHAALFRALNHFDGLEHLSGDFATVLLRNVAVRNRGGRASPCRNGRLLPRRLW